MRNIGWLTLMCVMVCLGSYAQKAGKAAKDAFLITRMVSKFHVGPRPVDKTFSADVFNSLMKEIDDERMFFTQEDMAALCAYKYRLDEEILGSKTTFLQQLGQTFETRLRQADTMVSSILKTPFNFSVAEKLTVAEDTSYPANTTAMRLKMYKVMKYNTLDGIVENIDFTNLTAAQQKKAVDSIEPIMRKKIEKTFSRRIKALLNRPQGVSGEVGDEYCNAIAKCFDPHTEYMPLSEKEDFESELGQRRVAFGFSLDEDEEGNAIIKDLVPGSPAFKSGQINKGDKIESVQWEGRDAVDVKEAGAQDVSEMLSASNHDKAIIKVRKADGTVRDVSLYKASLESNEDNDKVKSFLLKGSKTIGYISLPAFYEDWEDENGLNGCANDVAKEIIKLKNENIAGLILDVRYNGGGSLQEATELAGIFIDAGPVAQIKEKEGKVITLKDVNRGTIYDGPLILMINGYSASASEVIAGTLQDYNRAVIMGSPTYGKATGQVVLPLDTTINLDESVRNKTADTYLKTTVSQLFRVTGKTAQSAGVQPDIYLPDALEVYGQKEATTPFALPINTIEANKYYKPYAPVTLEQLKSTAANKINESPYFQQLQKYLSARKVKVQKKDMDLQLSKLLAEEKDRHEEQSFKYAKEANKVFTIENHSYEEQRLKVNSELYDMHKMWKQSISKDPYIGVAYDLICMMIK